MSYLTIATCVADTDYRDRVTACATQEGYAAGAVPVDLFWTVAAASDIEAAYAAALAANNPRPGADEAAITDQMILSAVQAAPPPP